ncbi:MAG: hypothetical protein HY245_11330 [Rhizobiales bacterium]|nr:hypothetical protein [Hyphomicrobiales bacterium]MBI3673984.1 hypothetical protein [Hyphomicrobiales bacterium]
MIRNIAITATALVALSMPALAAVKYYPVQDATTKKCSIVEKKPDGKTMILIGKTGFSTKAKAETALKADKACV